MLKHISHKKLENKDTAYKHKFVTVNAHRTIKKESPGVTQQSTYISKCLEILTPPPLHTTKHLYLEMSRDTLAKNEPRKASIYV